MRLTMGRNWRGASPLLPTSTLLASVGPNGNPNLEKPLKACTALRGQKQKHPQFFLRSSLMPALPTKQSHLATESHRRGPAGRGTASWGLWAAHNDDQRSMLVSQLRREHGPHHHLRSLQLRTLLPPEPPAADTSLPGCPQVLHTGCFTLGASHWVLHTGCSQRQAPSHLQPGGDTPAPPALCRRRSWEQSTVSLAPPSPQPRPTLLPSVSHSL